MKDYLTMVCGTAVRPQQVEIENELFYWPHTTFNWRFVLFAFKCQNLGDSAVQMRKIYVTKNPFKKRFDYIVFYMAKLELLTELYFTASLNLMFKHTGYHTTIMTLN